MCIYVMNCYDVYFPFSFPVNLSWFSHIFVFRNFPATLEDLSPFLAQGNIAARSANVLTGERQPYSLGLGEMHGDFSPTFRLWFVLLLGGLVAMFYLSILIGNNME